MHKAKDIQVQVARGAQQLALGCVQTQSQAAGLGCGAGANVECLRFVVHQRAVGGLAVDLDVQGVGADCQAVHPHKGGAGSTGREAGPAARQSTRGFQAGELFARNGQAEFHAREAQARQAVFECAVGVEAAVQARIGIEIGAANGQHVHSNQAGRLGYRAVSRDLRIAQRDLFAALLQRQVALDTEEAKHVELKVAAHLQQFALLSVHGQLQGCGLGAGVRAGGDGQVGLALCIVHHQRALGLGRNLGGAARLQAGECGAEGFGDGADHKCRHIHTLQAATKAHLQRFAGPEFDRGRGGKAAAHGRVERSHHGCQLRLHLGLGHAGIDLRAGDCLGGVREPQGEADVAGGTLQADGLQLAGFGLALGQVDGFDHRQAQVAVGVRAAGVVGGDVGHIHKAQASRKVEHKDVFALGALGRVDADRDLACAKQGV